MTERDIQIIIEEVRENRRNIMSIIERLTRVEEKTSRRATIFGLLGGLAASIPPLVYWLSKLGG